MLINEVRQMTKMYQESRESMKEMIEASKKEKLDTENGLEGIEELDLSLDTEEMEKQLKEMDEEFNKNFSVKEDSPTEINAIIEKLEENKKNFTSPEDIKKVDNKIESIKESLTLSKILEYKPLRNKKLLKKDFNNLSREVQTKLAKNSEYVFDSCFQLNKAIKEILLPENKDKSKLVSAFIYEYISTRKLNDIAVTVYFLLNNLYNMEKLEENNKNTLVNAINEIANKF